MPYYVRFYVIPIFNFLLVWGDLTCFKKVGHFFHVYIPPHLCLDLSTGVLPYLENRRLNIAMIIF
jgi:hypothetical protein